MAAVEIGNDVDGIAGFQVRTFRRRHHLGRELVAHDPRIHEIRLVALIDVHVGAADADAADAHQCLARAGHGHGALDDLQLAGFPAEDGFHGLRHAGRVSALAACEPEPCILASRRRVQIPHGKNGKTTMPRLSRATCKMLGYDPDRLETGIVHLGIGAFHRAHMADYTDEVLRKGDLRWGILGASLRSPDTRDALRPQDYLYTVAESDEAGERCRVIAAVKGILVAPEDPRALVAAMAQPSVKIVSLTVTEKGYCHDPATGELNEAHPDIARDLANIGCARLGAGLSCRGAARTKAAGPAALHRAMLRQSSLEWPDRAQGGGAAGRTGRSGAWQACRG